MLMNQLPFTSDQFFGVFTAYNQSIGWAAFLVYGGAAALAWLSLRPTRWSSRTLCFGLAALWLFTGSYYHLVHFTAVSPAGYLFGVLFIVQSILFVYAGIKRDLEFAPFSRPARVIGALLLVYALVFYPVIGFAFGERYPALPLFAAPCPLTIFTFGMLFWTRGRVPIRLLAVPVTWSLIGSNAIVEFGVVQDLAMPIAALTTTIFITRRNHTKAGLQSRAIGTAPAASVL
jgi:hypothetical protein